MLKANFADARGQPVVAATPDSVRGLDAAIDAYLGARNDARARLDAVLGEDPSCVLAHCMDGYLHLLSSKRIGFAPAARALDNAREAAGRLSALALRERAHVAALDAWCDGDLRGAAHHWDAALDQ